MEMPTSYKLINECKRAEPNYYTFHINNILLKVRKSPTNAVLRSYLARFLGTNSLSVLMCRKTVNQSINQSIYVVKNNLESGKLKKNKSNSIHINYNSTNQLVN